MAKPLRVWDGAAWQDVVGPGGVTYQDDAPSSPYVGQVWVDANDDLGPTGAVAYQATAPADPYFGLLWVDSDDPNLQMRIWDGAAWQDTGGAGGGGGSIAYGTTPPVAPEVGALWVDEDGSIPGVADTISASFFLMGA